MSLFAGQVVCRVFLTRDIAGVSVDADALPLVQFVLNGIIDPSPVAVTPLGNGKYVAKGAIPAGAAYESVSMVMDATVGTNQMCDAINLGAIEPGPHFPWRQEGQELVVFSPLGDEMIRAGVCGPNNTEVAIQPGCLAEVKPA